MPCAAGYVPLSRLTWFGSVRVGMTARPSVAVPPAPSDGVASVGVRPTVATEPVPVLEVFIFDFDAPLYGRRISVEFMHKLRDEERYEDIEALVSAIEADVQWASELVPGNALS